MSVITAERTIVKVLSLGLEILARDMSKLQGNFDQQQLPGTREAVQVKGCPGGNQASYILCLANVAFNGASDHFFLNPHFQVSGSHYSLVNTQKGKPVAHACVCVHAHTHTTPLMYFSGKRHKVIARKKWNKTETFLGYKPRPSRENC